MNRLAKFSARFIGNQGFSIGIDDVAPGPKLSIEKEKQVTKGYSACDAHIKAYEKGQLALQPGCNAAETLEVGSLSASEHKRSKRL
jgi:DNA-directed RNA polymerase III subunit RPC1